MNDSNLIINIETKYQSDIDSFKFSRTRKNKIKKCIKNFLYLAAEDFNQKYNKFEEVKPCILELLTYYIITTSINVFENDLDEYYDTILQKTAFAFYATAIHLLKQDFKEKDFLENAESINKIVYREYRNILTEIRHKCLQEIKDTDITRDSAYFWQMIFIKYTSDNNRIFYPNFFSDGYFITSEKQFTDLLKYWNKFFIITFFILGLTALIIKHLKSIFYFNILNEQNFILLITVLLIINIIYNTIVQKLIFKNCIKTSEKFWQNNYKTIKFLKTLIKQVTITSIITLTCMIIGVNCKEAYIGITVALVPFLGFLYYLRLKGKQIQSFVIGLERDAIKSFTIRELDKIKNIPNSSEIIENMSTPLKYYVDYMYKITNLDYTQITQKAAFFIRNFVRFNSKLYKLGIESTKHQEIIKRRFLRHFDCV